MSSDDLQLTLTTLCQTKFKLQLDTGIICGIAFRANTEEYGDIEYCGSVCQALNVENWKLYKTTPCKERNFQSSIQNNDTLVINSFTIRFGITQGLTNDTLSLLSHYYNSSQRVISINFDINSCETLYTGVSEFPKTIADIDEPWSDDWEDCYIYIRYWASIWDNLSQDTIIIS